MNHESDVCREAGRSLFFHYVGQYFARPPQKPASPPGSICPLCGANASDVPLFLNNGGVPQCLAQITITRKRAARSCPADSLVPAENPAGMTAMSEGTFVVAGPKQSMIITKLLPDVPLPPSLEVRFSIAGSITAAKKELIANPPAAPFAVILFEKNAQFPVDVSADPSMIIINGPNRHVISRRRIIEWSELCDRIGAKQVMELMSLRRRLAEGRWLSDCQREKDQAALLELQKSNVVSFREFRTLPDPLSHDAKVLRQMIK
jgi:hypothetical protein